MIQKIYRIEVNIFNLVGYTALTSKLTLITTSYRIPKRPFQTQVRDSRFPHPIHLPALSTTESAAHNFPSSRP